jgi:copper chaperone CopZ
VGKRSLIVYLVTILICALGSGIVMNEIGYQVIQQEVETAAESPAWYQHLAGLLLLLILANALWNRFREKHESLPEHEAAKNEEIPMNQPTVVNIEGMSCNHCVRAVKEALEELPDVNRAEVSLSGSAEVFGTASIAEISRVVEEVGYTVTSTEAS